MSYGVLPDRRVDRQAECGAVGLRDDVGEASTVDFDLHGLVGIRLVNPARGDVCAIERQLGPIQAELSREPDIVIRFIDRFALPANVALLGTGEAGFTDDAFLVLRGKNNAAVRVQIPFERIGNRCEIICQTGLPAVPLLIPIINLTALANGALALHASAFVYEGTSVLVTGWAKGGKTEMLLALMDRGAQYVGDEWIYLEEGGRRMVGIPEPIRIWDWHLTELPSFRRKLSRRTRMRLWSLKRAAGALDRATASWLGRRILPVSFLQRLVSLLRRQMYVQMPPAKLFGSSAVAVAEPPDKVFFVVSHAAPDVVVEAADPQQVAERMLFSLQEEQRVLMSYYRMFRFAFPERANELIDQSERLQRERLSRLLAGKETYVVRHPYPAPVPALFDAIRPVL